MGEANAEAAVRLKKKKKEDFKPGRAFTPLFIHAKGG